MCVLFIKLLSVLVYATSALIPAAAQAIEDSNSECENVANIRWEPPAAKYCRQALKVEFPVDELPRCRFSRRQVGNRFNSSSLSKFFVPAAAFSSMTQLNELIIHTGDRAFRKRGKGCGSGSDDDSIDGLHLVGKSFDGLAQLDQLLLSQLDITQLPADSNFKCGGPKLISLAQNRLTELPAGFVAPMYRLAGVELGQNCIDDVRRVRLPAFNSRAENETSKACPYHSFQTRHPKIAVDLHGNQIRSLSQRAFFGDLTPTTETDGGKTKTVNQGVGGWSRVTELNLSQNELSCIEPGAFEGLSSLRTLDLTENLLLTLTPSAFDRLNVVVLYLAGNPWHCNYAMRCRLRHLSIDPGRLQLGDDVTAICRSPAAVYAWSLQRLIDSRLIPLPLDETEESSVDGDWNKTAVSSSTCRVDLDCMDITMTEDRKTVTKFEVVIICTLFVMTVALVALCTVSVHSVFKRKFSTKTVHVADENDTQSGRSTVQLTLFSMSKDTVDGKGALISGNDAVVRKLAQKLHEDIVTEARRLLDRMLIAGRDSCLVNTNSNSDDAAEALVPSADRDV